MSAAIEQSLVRRYEDGIAVFDPLSWQTHILSRDGFELLLEMVSMAPTCEFDADRMLSMLEADAEVEQDCSQLKPWAQLACHLAKSFIAGS